MAATLTLIGAYGRTYKTKDAILADWRAGKDFKVCSGPYCSIRDISYMMRMNDAVELMCNTGERVRLFTHC